MTYILGLDTETTGLHPEKGDRIVEFCGQVYRAADRKLLIDITQRISNQGQKMNAKAQAVHGISTTDLIGTPKFKDFAPKIDAILKRVDVIVAHNAAFDMKFLATHMAETGLPMRSDLIIFDTMGEGMTTSYDAKPPSLREFCWAMGIEYDPDKAHAAKYDVEVMMKAFFVALEQGHMKLPETLKDQEKEAV